MLTLMDLPPLAFALSRRSITCALGRPSDFVIESHSGAFAGPGVASRLLPSGGYVNVFLLLFAMVGSSLSPSSPSSSLFLVRSPGRLPV